MVIENNKAIIEHNRTTIENQCIALAAIFQTADIAYRVATDQPFDIHCYESSLKSVLVVDADAVSNIYPDLSGLSHGIRFLNEYVGPNFTRTPAIIEKIKYVLGLIRLQKKLLKSPKILNQVQSDLAQCNRQFEFKNNNFDSQMIENLADVYVNSIGQLGFNIIVRGKTQTLNTPINAHRIRSVFLAGVRAAVLWHQLGGRQWHLVMKRNKLHRSLNHLSRG